MDRHKGAGWTRACVWSPCLLCVIIFLDITCWGFSDYMHSALPHTTKLLLYWADECSIPRTGNFLSWSREELGLGPTLEFILEGSLDLTASFFHCLSLTCCLTSHYSFSWPGMLTLKKNLGKVCVCVGICEHRSSSSEGCPISLWDCSKNCEVFVSEHLANPTNYSWSMERLLLRKSCWNPRCFSFPRKITRSHRPIYQVKNA